MLIGLLAGGVAALIGALLSLPLHSPDDAIFNSATVTIAALAAGLVAGVLRRSLSARRFAVAWGGLFVAAIAALAAGESIFERTLSFGLPIAAAVLGTTGLGVWLLDEQRIPRLPVLSAAAAVLAVAAGLGLVGQRDAESGSLSLPAAPAVAALTGASAAVAASTGATGSATAAAAASTGSTAPASRPNALPTWFAMPSDVKDVTFVVGEGSQATFTVTEQFAGLPLPNDAVMHSTALTGDIRLDGRPSRMVLDLLRLTSDQPRRDNFMRQMFRARPSAVLTVSALAALPDRYEAGQTVRQTVRGTLAINGVERPIAFDVEARLDGTVLHLLGKTSFVWKDFDIVPPSTPTVQVQDRVAVEVLLAGRPEAR